MIFVRKYVQIVKRINFLLEQKKLKQKDLAKTLGKSESEISKWLGGEHNLTLRSIAKLEAALGEEIIHIPVENEMKNYIGWKKTSVPALSMYVNIPSTPEPSEDFQQAEKMSGVERQVEVA